LNKELNTEKLWNDGKSSLYIIKEKLKNQKDVESVAVELALLFDSKFDRF
jgi:hypothetical protein